MANLKKLNEGLHLSLTLSKCKFIKNNWIKNIPEKELEYNAIQFSIGMWKKIINLLHIKPNDFKLTWFTKYVFEEIFHKMVLL